MKKQQLSSTMEDYLEALFLLSREKGAIRVKNIAKKLDVKMPTVTNMLKALSEKGMIDYEKHEYLELTQTGRAIVQEIDTASIGQRSLWGQENTTSSGRACLF